jgi:hypothetical protein
MAILPTIVWKFLDRITDLFLPRPTHVASTTAIVCGGRQGCGNITTIGLKDD